MHEWTQDLRYGFRMLFKTPTSTTAAVVSLALGIGANTAIYSLLDAVLFRPFPVKEPGGLVALYSSSERELEFNYLSYPDYADYEQMQEVFSGLLAYFRQPLSVGVEGSPERLWGELVSGNYFALLGLTMPLGRAFLSEEVDLPGGEELAVISYDLWKRRFGADRAALGKNLEVNGKNFTIVGVAPRGFHGMALDLGMGSPTDLWLPLKTIDDPNSFWQNAYYRRDARLLRVLGRLGPEVTLEQAKTVSWCRPSCEAIVPTFQCSA